MDLPVGGTLAELTRAALAAAGRSARDVSVKAGLGETALRDILSGRVKSPRVETLQAVADEINQPIGPIAPRTRRPQPEVSPALGVRIPRLSEMPRDLPVFGTAAGANGDGSVYINEGDVVDYVRRPPGLVGEVFGLYIEGDSMEPALKQGALIVVDRGKTARIGDNVVVIIASADGPDEAFVKELVKAGPDKIIVKQFNPARSIEFPRRQVRKVFRVLTTEEMLSR